MNAQELAKRNLMAKMLAGSHAYGTNIATSDTDYRGLFTADPINILTPFFPVREAVDSDEEDTKYFELWHFMKLCLDCNPNIIELLWTDDSDIIFRTPAYDFLRENRHKLLSSKIAFTTSGYAIAQLKRIKGHNKWINNPQPENPPLPCDYVSLVQWFGQNKLLPRDFNIMVFKFDHLLIPYSETLFGVYPMQGYQSVNDDGSLNTKFEGDREHFRHPLALIKWNRDEYKAAKETHSQYWQWKRNRNETRSDLEEQFGYDCYTDDTDFLTNTGWKKFDDVLDTDTLATFNELSHKVEYQAPTERIDSLFTGNLYHLTGYHVDTLVTSNHNMFVRPYSRTNKTEGNWGYHRAAELPETFDTLNVINPKKNRQLLPHGFKEQILQEVNMLSYLRLVGWYVSEGTMGFYEDGSVKSMMISQSKPQSRLTQTITKLINYGKIRCKSYIYEARGLASYPECRWLFEKSISQYIYNDCGHKSDTKRLPSWCFFLTKREMATLLVSLVQGDGTKKDHQNHTYVYYTINKNLADDVQRLAFLCGFETSLYGPYPIDSTFETANSMYHIHINMRPQLTRRHVRSASVQAIPVKNKRIVCFMVPNYTLITRRNGDIGLHGNTKHAMHLVRLLRMGVESLRDGQVIVKRPDAEELLRIRNGAWKYEELVAYAEDMDKQVREVWYKKTSLPKKPDVHFAAQLLMDVQKIAWDSQVKEHE